MIKPSAFALEFAARRFEEALSALGRLSHSLSAHIKSAAGQGPVPERMQRASEALQALASGGMPDSVASELRSSFGPEYDQKAVSTLLLAHVSGLRSLATLEGLGAAILGHYASAFLDRLERHLRKEKLDREKRDAVDRSIRFRIRLIMTEFDPDESDNPLAVLASKNSEAEVSAFVSVLIADAPDPNASAETNGIIYSFSGGQAKSWDVRLREIRSEWHGAGMDILLEKLHELAKTDPKHFHSVLEMVIKLPSTETAATYVEERIAMHKASRK